MREDERKGLIKSNEKTLYNQIHPAKLLIDWISTVPALHLLWQHEIVLGLIVAFAPSIATILLVVKFA
jgi:hypothetical protein